MARRRKLAASDLDGKPWIAVPRALNPEARDRFVQTCRDCGFLPDIYMEASTPATALSLVAAGMGYTMVQASLRAGAHAGIVFRELPWFPLRVHIHAAWRSADPNPLLAELRTILAGMQKKHGADA
jgi:DNA-binding transcriptional LysR family regulator